MDFTDTELEAIEQFILNGAHIIPFYPDSKAVPKGFSWSDGDMHLKSIPEVEYHAANGCCMALLLETANCVLVDIDNLLPMTVKEMKVMELDVGDYRRKKKDEWKNLDAKKRNTLLDEIAEEAVDGTPEHVAVPSGSGKGMHFYYRVKDPKNICRVHTNIEIFGNRRLGYVHFWGELADYWNTEPVDLADILRFWKPKQKQYSDLHTIRATKKNTAGKVVFKETANGKKVDYEAYVASSDYASISEPNACFVWLAKAYQLDDMDGVREGLQRFSLTLPRRKLDAQHDGARNFAARYPDTHTPRYDNNRKFKAMEN